jgi:drug/metabolite transporter (DMT)-like permease
LGTVFWLVPALAAPLLWGASNLVDEHLVNRAERDPLTLAIIAGIFASLPAIFVIATGRWIWCGWDTATVAPVGGALGIVVYLPYLAALRIASPSVVILMWTLSPVAIVAIAHFTVKELRAAGAKSVFGLAAVKTLRHSDNLPRPPSAPADQDDDEELF